MKDDRDYYRRRIEQEMVAARITSCPLARDVHLELADLYSSKLRVIEASGERTQGPGRAQGASQTGAGTIGLAR